MSPGYKYVKNQYLLGKFSDEDLLVLVGRKVITDAERVQIIGGL